LLFGAHHRDRLVKRDAHWFFQQYVHARVQRVDGAFGVGRVVRADRHGVQLLRLEHRAVVGIQAGSFHIVMRLEFCRFAFHQIRKRYHLDIGHAEIAFNMGFRDPPGADDADFQLSPGMLFFFLHLLPKVGQYLVANCHDASS
jgi:hypothetical protein